MGRVKKVVLCSVFVDILVSWIWISAVWMGVFTSLKGVGNGNSRGWREVFVSGDLCERLVFMGSSCGKGC